ncbi:hypothetical protein FBR05_02355 [Deltaproteobacteria bacterium PRO3]|nr:hypothetical protein [Deltaproteobacteria bacterium PRO3]
MPKKIVLFAALLTLAAPSLSFALGECREDRKKFCPGAGLNEDKIKACLKSNYASLSEPCKQMINEKIEEKIEKKLESQSK